MTAVQPQRFTFATSSDAALAGYHWPAGSGSASAATRPGSTEQGRGQPALAPLIVVHGFAEHARRHAGLAEAAAAAGHAVYSFDQRGHGESEGARAVVAGYEGALAAVAALVDRATGPAGSGPRPLLFGHSMGGAIALTYALSSPERLAALMLSAPALLDAVKRPAWLLNLAGPIARLAPAMPVATLDVTRISRDPGEVKRYRDDPLIYHGGAPAITGYTITWRGAELLDRANELRVPTLIVHGEADGIIDVAGSRRLAAGAAEGTVRLHTFPGAYHELHHDLVTSGVPGQAQQVELAFLATHGTLTG